jgi:hypothetical protein
MHPKSLFLVTACVEAATGLCLLLLPTLVLAILLGLEPRVETILVGRITGAALLAIGIASWTARTDTLCSTPVSADLTS